MRWQALLAIGLFGLAVATPAWAQTAPAGMEAPAFMETATASPSAAYPAQAAAPRHHHMGWFGWRSCAECQRARAKARDGVDVPPPPSTTALPAGTVVPGSVVYSHNHSHSHSEMAHAPQGTCVACEQAAGATVVTSGPVMISDSHAPGYASAGGASAAGYASVGGASAAGYASVGGPSPAGGDSSPSPIGVARAHTSPAGAMVARPSYGTQDPSVMPTSAAIPAAPTPMGKTGPTRPHILGHLFGWSDMASDYREHRGQKAQKERDAHAAISYDEKDQPVTEIPASMVYGPGGH